MKKSVFLCLMLFAGWKACAQFGLTVATTINSSPNWQVLVENFVTHRHMDFLRNGTMAVIDYTLPGSSARWRFQPAIQGMRATSYYFPHYFEAYTVGFQYNVSYSPIELGFNKKPSRIFFTLSPGLSMVGTKYEEPVLEGNVFKGNYIYHTSQQVAFHIGAAAFTTFEFSPMLTLSPVVGFRIFPNIDWRDFTFTLTEGDLNGTYDRTTWRQLFFALRFGLQLRKEPRN